MDTLNSLESLAMATDAETIAAQPVDPNAPPPPPSTDEQAADLVNTFAALVTGYAPEAADIWNEAARARCAVAVAPVMEKYGWSMTAIPPELVAAIVVGPLLYQTSKIVAGKMKAAKVEKATKADEPEFDLGKAAAADAGAPPAPVHEQMKLYQK